MADRKIAYGASSNMTVTALDGLAASATHVTGWESPTIDNTTDKYLDYMVSGKFTVESSGLTAGEIRIWVVPMLDDSTWPGGFDGTASAETAPLDDANGTAAGAKLAASAQTDTTASQVYCIAQFSVASLFGGVCPKKFSLFITQSTVAALETTGNQITYYGVYETIT